jgi:hypothetical protein
MPERRPRRATLRLIHSTVPKFFYGKSPKAIALALALGEANANADFFISWL